MASLSGNVVSRTRNIIEGRVRKSVLFRKEFWHKGFATEAAIACKEYAFQELNFDEVYSIIRDSNVASQNVARRNGMVEVDTLVKHYRGVEMPHIVFRVSRGNNFKK